ENKVVLAAAVACALAQPGLLAPGVTAYHGLGPIAPLGSFSYVSPEGLVFKTDYVADALGYRVASNALPVDTPAVVAARSAHLAAHAAALHRVRRQIIAPFAIGHTPAATAPLGHHAAIAAPLAAPIAAPLAAPIAIGHTPAATAPLGHPIAAPFAAHYF
ncbi:hypothetical protein C0J52_20174, partial [Blattella germanica]